LSVEGVVVVMIGSGTGPAGVLDQPQRAPGACTGGLGGC